MESELSQKLKAVRIECAITICLTYPSLYTKIKGHGKWIVTPKESIAANVLENLLKLEPCVGHILDFYYKRELR